jgi:TRAP-type C4-dicarboxylate transport system substrate-binding protein
MTERRKIRWLIAHYPAYLFIRTAKAFKLELEKMCPGEFDIEILTMAQYVEQYNKFHEFAEIPPSIEGLDSYRGNKPANAVQNKTWTEARKKWKTLFAALGDGEFELSQTQISIIGTYMDPSFNAIDLPFLFNDHDHVSRVLDGDIGDSLCNNIAEKTNIRGLAFTYSGGYRVIGANQKITNLSELAQTRLMTHTIHSDTLFAGIGANPLRKFNANENDLADMATDPNSAIETTYLRFAGSHVYKTDHSMFTTNILTGNKFWDSLTEAQQNAFRIAAKKTAKHERKWSIDDAKKYEDDAVNNGVEIVAISDEDRAQLQQASYATYDAERLVAQGIDPALVQSIIDAGNKTIH